MVMTRHAAAQFRARADQTRFGGRDGDSQLACHVPHRQSLDIAEKHDIAHQAGDSSHFRSEDLGKLDDSELALRVRPGSRQLNREASRLGRRFPGSRQLNREASRLGRRFIEVDKAGTPPDSHQHQAFIGDDPRQPCRELRFALILVEMQISFYKSILRLVLRITPIAKEKTAQIHAFAPMPLDQFAKGVLVSTPSSFHELQIGHFREFHECVLHIIATPFLDFLSVRGEVIAST
ncbi:hypothetical protein SBA3_1040043 [Candidatus Sulfopaludibacter sp. SbA3]|nr:hypothetical protein SBA3_1040043 [Candidatus Sulfopaludibacter sp. SbA3]